MRVGNDERAQDGVHDGVEGASGEGSDGEGDEADGDQSVVDVSLRLFFLLRVVGRSGRDRIDVREDDTDLSKDQW